MGTDIEVDLDRLLADGKIHDPGDRETVAQAYVKLIDCIATYPARARTGNKIPEPKNNGAWGN